MTRQQTEPRKHVGQNVKGTPAMPARKVRHDVKQVRRHAHSFGLQEFKWPWYWRILDALAPVGRWGLYPGRAAGLRNPVAGAQAVGWRSDVWRKVRVTGKVLMPLTPGIVDERHLRAALIEDRATKLQVWIGSTHLVVSGDRSTSSRERRALLADNLDVLETFLRRLARSGDPIIFELDANIHHGTEAWKRLASIVRSFGGRFYGELGVEYLFVIPGRRGKAQVVVEDAWTIPTGELFTDHEGRGITFRLEG